MTRHHTAAGLASAVVLLAACGSDPLAPVAPASPAAAPTGAAFPRSVAAVIPGQYLVLLRHDAAATTAVRAARLDRALARLQRGALRRSFRHAVDGFAAQLSDSAAAALRADPDVALVEPDPVVRASATQTSAPWGLDRIDQAALPLNGSYTYATSGAGVSVYIVDTGIRVDHAEFDGRATAGYDFVTSGGTAADCHGHGTHVAGTVGGSTYGVAKAARLVAVRVLDCAGSGSGSNVVAALDWVVQQKRATPSTPAVVNMSLSGGAAAVLDSAVARTVRAGVTVVVAAGNAGADACTQSPARVPDAITVGATGGNDAFAWFSNHGACVDLSAPGVGIVSAAAASATATGTMSGTSMAAPHAAGAAALYLGANTAATPAQVGATLAARATSDVLTGVPFGTPNKLLSIAFMNDATAPAPPPAPSPAPVPLHNVTLVGQGAGRCLDADGSQGHANGSVAQLWDCFGNENQRWTLPPVGAAGEVRIWGGMCLDNDRGAWAEGDKVHVWTCLGNENQRWTLTADGQIRGKNNQCLTALDGGTANGTRLVLSACAARPEQRWTVR